MTVKPVGGTWNQSYWYDAQTIHTLAGALILFAGLTHGLDIIWLYGIFFVVTFLKEYVLDLSPFENDTVAGSTWDFSMYQVGALGGFIAAHYFWIGTVLASLTVATLFLVDLTGKMSAMRAMKQARKNPGEQYGS